MVPRPSLRRSRSTSSRLCQRFLVILAVILVLVELWIGWKATSRSPSRPMAWTTLPSSSILSVASSSRPNGFQRPYAARVIVWNSHAVAETLQSGRSSRWFDLPEPNVSHIEHDPRKVFLRPYEMPFYYGECRPMKEWQTTFYPTCNLLHERPLLPEEHTHVEHHFPTNYHTLLSREGSWRHIWQTPDQLVLKTLKMWRDFGPEPLMLHTTDAMVMERLTSSKYIVNLFAFCGQSVVTEMGSGSFRMLLKNKTLTGKQRLRLGRELARALDDMHSIDAPHSQEPTLAHNDLNLANILLVDGHIKLNDFNVAVPMRWNGTKPCGYPPRYVNLRWKSPEEIRNTTYIDPAKSDIYTLGLILFQVLTLHQPYLNLEPGGRLKDPEMAKCKLNGTLPHIPDDISFSSSLSSQALRLATLAALRQEPERRPTAYELANALGTVLKWVRNRENTKSFDDVKRLFAALDRIR